MTPPVNYYYDNAGLPSGAPASFNRGYSTEKLVAVTYGSGSSNGDYRGYDELGRVIRQVQQTDGVNYLTEATYYPNSAMATETYPSVPGASDRRTVSYSLDSAARLSSLSSSATSYAPAASVSSIAYAPHSALTTETYGNNLVHAVTYNTRLQPNEIKLGASGNPTSVLDLTYSYGTTSNNGNVQSITYTGGGLSYTQSFTYDALNRLATAQENSGSSWSQTNAYDRYGNRQIDYGGGNYNLSFSTSTNRITTSGFVYDAAGNLLNDALHSYTFDAENKISKVDAVTAYTYDGEGQRVRKLVGENTRFVYGIGGQLVAEYDGSTGNLKKEYIYGSSLITIEPTAVNSNGTQYLTSDHLGSPRVVTNSSASVVSRHDYLPFGEELFAGTGGRTAAQGYSQPDGVRFQFTSKERDNETGLDFFISRYYSSTQGRFTGPDPYNIVLEKEKGKDEQERQRMLLSYISQPQIWNKYSYTINNPLKHTDPDGRRPMTQADWDRIKKLLDEADQIAKQDNNPALQNAVCDAAKAIIQAIADVPNDAKSDPANLKAVFWAIDNLGNTAYGKEGTVSNGVTVTIGRGENKCNLFVANAYAMGAGVGFGGKGVPTFSTTLGGLLGRKNPASANDLSNPSASIPNFPRVTTPGMGDVVAMPPGPYSLTGHSGIYAGGGVMLYAGPNAGKVETVDYVKFNGGIDVHPSVEYRTYKP